MAKLKLWEKASNYMGEDYSDYYMVAGRHRDSGLLGEANFQAALKMLGGESKSVIVARSSHWAAGWVEVLLVHKDDEKKVEKAQEIADALEDYPVLDDELYSRLEYEANIENVKEAGYKFNLTEKEAEKVLRWLYNNDVNVENIDDRGYWPEDDDLEAAVKAIRQRKTRTTKGRPRKRSQGKQLSLKGIRR